MVVTDPAFALHLGNGVYLDSDGNIHHGPAPTTLIYQAEFKLPIDPKKAADAFKSVSDALKDVDKSPEVIKKITDIYGFFFSDINSIDAKLLLGMLSTISKIAGTVAPVLLVIGFAIDVAKMLGLFNKGPSALEKLVTKRLDDLQKAVGVIAQLIKDMGMVAGRDAINALTADAADYVNRLRNTNPNPAQLEALSIKLDASLKENRAGIQLLLNVQTWRTLFDPVNHSQIWGLMQRHLFLLPGGPDELPVPALLRTMPSNEFDHRLMVPLASYAGEAFLAGLRSLAPEYRSTGEYSTQLHNFANDIAALAQSMRAEVLARTIYTPDDFTVLLDPAEVIQTDDFFDPEPIAISPSCSRFPVGAIDLRYHDNLFFADFLNQLIRAEFYGWERTTRKATMDFRWLPPANLIISHDHNGKRDGFRITNPAECAAAANAQSELDYAELLSVSGYAQLLQLATLFRNESTDPDRSQTVQVFTPLLARSPQPSKTVTVESEPVPLTGKITASARRDLQKCTASVDIWTQPIKRVLPIEYKIRLRTLRSIWGANRWREPVYSAFQFVHYEPDPKDRNFMELRIDERDAALDAVLMIEGHSPPNGPRSAGDTVQLKAHTFDWWIPVKPPFSLEIPFEKTEHALRGLGHSTTTVDTTKPRLAADIRTMADPGARFGKTSDVIFENSFPKLSFLDGSQDWEGEHRDPQEIAVTLKYRLTWDADRMHITLEADPADRNYVVYVVVEEKLQSGVGHVLHTAMPVPINGQLTFIPESFFDAERAAIERAAKAAAEFNRKYSISTEVGPNDPIVGWLRPGDLATVTGVAKVIALAQQHQPEILREVLAEH